MSAYKEGKYFFDKMFVDKWSTTPVHYAGQEFDGTNIPQWVNPSFTPVSSDNASLTKGVKRISANLFVPCWAETDVDVMELMDEVSQFVEDNAGGEYQILHTAVVDHGWHESNKVFGILMFSVTYRVGMCIPVPVITQKQIVNNGFTIVNNGAIITN